MEEIGWIVAIISSHFSIQVSSLNKIDLFFFLLTDFIQVT